MVSYQDCLNQAGRSFTGRVFIFRNWFVCQQLLCTVALVGGGEEVSSELPLLVPKSWDWSRDFVPHPLQRPCSPLLRRHSTLVKCSEYIFIFMWFQKFLVAGYLCAQRAFCEGLHFDLLRILPSRHCQRSVHLGHLFTLSRMQPVKHIRLRIPCSYIFLVFTFVAFTGVSYLVKLTFVHWISLYHLIFSYL